MLFKLLMPPDAKFMPTIRQVAERVAQCAGYTATEAQRIGAGVGRVVEVVLSRLRPAQASSGGQGAHGAEPLDIRFQRDGRYLDVWLRYRADPCDRPAVDPALSREAIEQGMDSAEFGLEGDIAVCRLRRELPRDKVDHQCEAPDGK